MKDINQTDIQDTLEKVKAHDEKHRKTIYRFMFVYLIAGLVYLGVFVVNPDPEITISERVSGLSYVIGFLILGVYFGYYQKMLSKLDYTLPLIMVIKKAEKRYHYLNKKLLWLFLAVIFVGVGVVISVQKRLPNSLTTAEAVSIVSAAYILLLVISFFMGKKRWEKTEKPIWLKLKQALKE